MARIIYESDAGHTTSFDISESLITKPHDMTTMAVWIEILQAFKLEIIATNNLHEAEHE